MLADAFSDATVPHACAYSVHTQLQYHDTAVTSTEHHRFEIDQQSVRAFVYVSLGPHASTAYTIADACLATRILSLVSSVRTWREDTAFVVEGTACLNWHCLRQCLDVRAAIVLHDDRHQLLDQLRVGWGEVVSFLSYPQQVTIELYSKSGLLRWCSLRRRDSLQTR